MNKNLLITGGAGFIGSNFVHFCRKNHPGSKIVVIDKLSYAADIQNLQLLIDNQEIQFVHDDINNRKRVQELLKDHKIDTIVHFAAESHVDRSIATPFEFIQSNIVGTYNLLEAAKNAWLDNTPSHRFHHISTDEVYGALALSEAPFNESTNYAPNSPYSASKASSDHLVNAYAVTYGLQVSISNCSNNYGKFQHREKLIPKCISNILHNTAIPIYGSGDQIRDWIHVDDHCRAIDLIINKAKPGTIYNVGGANEVNNNNLVLKLCDTVDKYLQQNNLQAIYPNSPIYNNSQSRGLITYVEDRKGHDFRYAIDGTKIKSELGYMPEVNFEQGLMNTIEWYAKDNISR